MCVRVADDLRLFELLCESNPRTVEELASTTTAEPALIRRVLRTLASIGFVAQLGSENYGPTAISKQMVMRSVRAGVKFFHEESLPSVRHAPEFFKQNGYRLPRTMNDGP
jgi:DNA-binding IclR family transcriptional regulator